MFFFMISGFVISYTLENTPTLSTFFKNRFVRLFPSMLLCSLITWLVAMKLDDKDLFINAHQAKNLLPGITFINPGIWSFMAHRNFAWISGSYWTIWTEVQFYVVVSVTYFLSRKYFFRNILLLTIAMSCIKYIPGFFLNIFPGDRLSPGWRSFFSEWKFIDERFNIIYFISWFMVGIFFHDLYKGRSVRLNSLNGIGMAIIFLYLLVTAGGYASPIIYLLMVAAFLLMIYRKKYLSFLDNALFRRIGLLSYSVYLIHETIGILLINKYGAYLGDWSPLSPLIVIVLVILFAELSYRFYEKKLSLLLKRIL